jgi:hypothetical protein
VFVLAVVPVAAYFAYVGRWAFNAPLMDDMTLVESVNRFEAEGLAGLGRILLQQLNDHRVVFARGAALVAYGLHGYLDVRWMALVGYVNLLLLGGVLYRMFRTTTLPVAYFLPVPFLLFSPHLYQISLWGLVAFQPPVATLFSLAALLVLAQRRGWGWALPLGALAPFAGGNGLVVLLSGGLLLTVLGQFRRLGVWLVMAVGVAGLYFHDFHLSEASAASRPTGLVSLLADLLVNVTVFAGSYLRVFSDSKAVPLSAALGLVLLVGYVALGVELVRPSKAARPEETTPRINWLLHTAWVNMLGTAAMIALARAGSGAAEMVSDRFHLYSTVLLITFYLVAVASLPRIWRQGVLAVVLPFSVLVNAYAYLQYRPARDNLVEGLAADAYNYPRHGVFLHQFPHFIDPKPPFYRHCHFPTLLTDGVAGRVLRAARTDSDRVDIPVRVTWQRAPVPFQSGLFPTLDVSVGPLPTGTVPQSAVWLFLANVQANRLFFIAPKREKNPLATLLTTGYFYNSRLYATFPDKLSRGTYRLGLCWFNGPAPVVCFTRQMVRVR